MIKHRFIIRDVSDFRVFAAIPVESSLLTWKKWVRPPDWKALEELFLTTIDALTRHADEWHKIAENYLVLADIKLEFVDASDVAHPEAKTLEDTAEEVRLHRRKQAASALEAAKAAEGALDDAQRVVTLLKNMPDAPPAVWDAAHAEDPTVPKPGDDYITAILGQIEIMRPFQSIDDVEFEELKSRTHEELDYFLRLAKVNDTEKRRKFLLAARAIAAKFHSTYDILQGMVDTRIAIVRTHDTALKLKAVQSDPLPTTPCPPGLPFAAYTVEFDDVVVSVVEGCAWVSSRPLPPVSKEEQAEVARQARRDILKLQAEADATGERKTGQILVERNAQRKALQANPAPATPDERRVVEIVSQMLCERSLNPKADTRIPVREIDPAKAHQTREAERRDTAKGSATIRTIKFEVTPPRYLREAAEHILSNPRRAHWVIGHWRNQFHGEKRALRRQTWIKPHIRGLGEASGTTTRVVAPHEGASVEK